MKRHFQWINGLLAIGGALMLSGCFLTFTEEDQERVFEAIREVNETQEALLEGPSTPTETTEPDTPTPLPTETPPPTDTPVPTETPVPPTATPVPPTTTPTPEPIVYFQVDGLDGGTFNCDTQEAVDDAEVDITFVQGIRNEDNLDVHVLMGQPLENDYSFAVIVGIQSGPNTSGFLWELHEEEFKAGEVNMQDGQVMEEQRDGIDITHDLEQGSLNFSFPISNTIAISNAVTFVNAFHTPFEDSAKHCDFITPIEFQVTD